MITNQKCDTCAFAVKCLAKSKLKPFSNEARTDLGVSLDFTSCKDYKFAAAPKDEDEQEEE